MSEEKSFGISSGNGGTIPGGGGGGFYPKGIKIEYPTIDHSDLVNLQKKRTISLEAYLKMQNDWMLHLEPRASGSTKDAALEGARHIVDALLKHNNVVVEE